MRQLNKNVEKYGLTNKEAREKAERKMEHDFTDTYGELKYYNLDLVQFTNKSWKL